MSKYKDIDMCEDKAYVDMCVKANTYLKEKEELFSSKLIVNKYIWIPTSDQLQKMIDPELLWEIVTKGVISNTSIGCLFGNVYYDWRANGWFSWIDKMEKFWLLIYMCKEHFLEWHTEKKEWVKVGTTLAEEEAEEES